MTLELRPAHDPTRAYGFAGVVLLLRTDGLRPHQRGLEGGDASSRFNVRLQPDPESPAEKPDTTVLSNT